MHRSTTALSPLALLGVTFSAGCAGGILFSTAHEASAAPGWLFPCRAAGCVRLVSESFRAQPWPPPLRLHPAALASQLLHGPSWVDRAAANGLLAAVGYMHWSEVRGGAGEGLERRGAGQGRPALGWEGRPCGGLARRCQQLLTGRPPTLLFLPPRRATWRTISRRAGCMRIDGEPPDRLAAMEPERWPAGRAGTTSALLAPLPPSLAASLAGSQVATPEDPASARLGESLYAFIPRSIWGNLVDGYSAEARRCARRGIPLLSPRNRCARESGPSHGGGRMPGPRCLHRHAGCHATRTSVSTAAPLGRSMVWWLACPAALAAAAYLTCGWKGLLFAVGQAVIRCDIRAGGSLLADGGCLVPARPSGASLSVVCQAAPPSLPPARRSLCPAVSSCSRR